ncbi:MAG: hypothetical protein H0V82_13140 [Candidatus Protochlamydia sp.]|nr:hypothetical protein [Candidatus Protochlamydia sp.]
MHAISFLPIEGLPTLSLTSHYGKKVAWISYWDKIFACSDYAVSPEKTILRYASARLEPLLNSTDLESKFQLNDFMKRCQSKNVTTQVNLIRNLFRSIHPLSPETRLETFLINLFKHSLCPIACKMKIVDYVHSMRIPILNQLQWKGDSLKKGLFALNNCPFKLEIVPLEHTFKIQVHKDHSFERGEVVAVIEKIGFTLGKSTLYFGKVDEKIGKLWRIYLQQSSTGNIACITLKSPEEIGKFHQGTSLPYFLQ